MFAIFPYMTVNTFDQVSTCRREKSTSSMWQIEYDDENTVAILVRMTLLAKIELIQLLVNGQGDPNCHSLTVCVNFRVNRVFHVGIEAHFKP